MDKDELIFSGDCAINFDDLGQFKDYGDDIDNMLKNLIEIKNNEKTQLNHQLFREILKADPEDTFHSPSFKQLINETIEIMTIRKQYFTTQPQLYKLIFHNLLQILEESFVSYQFSQDLGPKICAFFIDQGKRKSFSAFQKMEILMCLSKLTKRLSYIDQIQRFCEFLYCCIDEQSIVLEKDVNEDWRKIMLNVYSQVIELSTRNRMIRGILSKKINEQSMLTLDHLFLGYKINLWQNNSQKINLYLKRMETQLLTNYQVFKLAVQKLS